MKHAQPRGLGCSDGINHGINTGTPTEMLNQPSAADEAACADGEKALGVRAAPWDPGRRYRAWRVGAPSH